jgi:hypothetical protein
MIYCDSIGHLVSDNNLDELHEFAEKLFAPFATPETIRGRWFQNKDKYGRPIEHPHYDLCKKVNGVFETSRPMIQKAIKQGAVYLDLTIYENRLKFKVILDKIHNYALRG